MTTGTPGADSLSTTMDGETILGLGGNDTLTSTNNNATLNGGFGGDTLITELIVDQDFTGPADQVFTNTLIGSNNRDVLNANVSVAGVVNATVDIVQDGGGGSDTITSNLYAGDVDLSLIHI